MTGNMQAGFTGLGKFVIRAPLKTILPSFITAILEMGVPGYFDSTCISGEKRLSLAEVRALISASIYFGALEHAVGKDFDYDRVNSIFLQSLSELKELSSRERVLALELIDRFRKFKIVRAEHSFDDWLCEALWEQFQSVPYAYPSAMSAAIESGLSVRLLLNKCALEY